MYGLFYLLHYVQINYSTTAKLTFKVVLVTRIEASYILVHS